MNFALYSAGARGVILCLFTESDLQNGKVSFEVQLDAMHNKTGDIWHIALPQLDVNLLYGKFFGKLCTELVLLPCQASQFKSMHVTGANLLCGESPTMLHMKPLLLQAPQACYRHWSDACGTFMSAGFRVIGEHEEEEVIDHCTMDTFDSMQSAEESVTIINPGQRFNAVSPVIAAPHFSACTNLLLSAPVSEC